MTCGREKDIMSLMMRMCIGTLVRWSCGIYGGRRMQED